MKIITMLLPVLFAMLVAACTQPKVSVQLLVKVRPDAYIVDGHTYATSAELTAALKALPRPDAIGLLSDGEISPVRYSEAISVVQAAGLNVPIGVVGNEVFY